MNYRVKIMFPLLLISVLLLSWANLILLSPTHLQNTSQDLYILAEPLLDIDGNAQLAAAASSGNGFSWDPYIIQDKIINASGLGTHGISISNTDAYFILRNCTVSDTDLVYSGIILTNVTNARIKNNTLKYNDFIGISLVSSWNNTLTGNTANNNYHGIWLNDIHDNTLTDNTANDNLIGIWLWDGHDNNLTGNTATDNAFGICLGSSDENTLTGNTVNDNHYAGIYLYFSDDNNLTDNIAKDNQKYGIELYMSNYNTITGNTLHGNPHCIVEEDCTGNILENNDCSIPIPGFPWALVLVGFTGLSLLVLAIKRKEDLQPLSFL